MKIAIIKWEDASLHGQQTLWEDDIKEVGLMPLISAGVVAKEDDEQITLSLDHSSEEKSWRSTETYPKSGIKAIKYIDIPKKWAKK